MQNYEIEIKSLLGAEDHANKLRGRMRELDSATTLVAKDKQLNHYFIGGDIHRLAEAAQGHLTPEANIKMKDLAVRAKNFSIRTAFRNESVHLVVKASVDDTTSDNGIARMEFQEKVGLTLDELDQVLLQEGFKYQAKWSREREEWLCRAITVCLDKNAGYGWLAEFEKVVPSADLLDKAKAEIIELMQACGVEELPQARLERMFAHYNAHWPEYYGTEKIFTIE